MISIRNPIDSIRKDKAGNLRKINHNKAPVTFDNVSIKNGFELAVKYIEEARSLYQIQESLDNIRHKPEPNPGNSGRELRFKDKKSIQTLSTYSFVQTILGIPLWRSGFAVRVNEKNNSVIGSVSKLYYDNVELPNYKTEDFQKFKSISPGKLAQILNFGKPGQFYINNDSNLYIYKYLTSDLLSTSVKDLNYGPYKDLEHHIKNPSLSENNFRIVREVLFSHTPESYGLLNWRCFLDLLTGEILYLEAFVHSISGFVFEYDPITQGGNVTVSSDSTALNKYRSPVTLQNLEAPSGNIQELRGDSATGLSFVVDPIDHSSSQYPILDSPAENPPNENTGINFNYDSRSADFAAVNAYYHIDRFLDLIEDLGINLRNHQFPNTSLPLPSDHRALQDQPNATAPGNANNDASIGIRFGAAFVSQFSGGPYLGISTSYRIVLHEFGHVLLYDYIKNGVFDFSHSFGDSLAAIIHDPVSLASDRFETFPFLATISGVGAITRRHDRDVNNGWAWDGTKDDQNYNSEQILSSSIFRAYLAIGGDCTGLWRKQYASRNLTLLLLKCVQLMSETTSPTHVEDFINFMEDADTNPIFAPTSLDNIGLGASYKAIRWAFEKQGAYQSIPLGDKEGDPPAVDVYIDDGRNGEYLPAQNNFWSTGEIVNRRQSDGIFSHQIPQLNVTNYIYARVKNRGTQQANDVVIKGYKSPPGGGGVWPQDWQAMQVGQITAPNSLGAGQSMIVGPLEWTPTQQGHECVLITVSATGDEANTESVNSVPNWFLIPADNNVIQRNLVPAPGKTGSTNLVKAFDIFQFWVRNPFHHSTEVTLVAQLPSLLTERGWSLNFLNTNNGVVALDSFDREGVLVQMEIEDGESFRIEDVLNADDLDIIVKMVVDDGVIGGMTYRIDPDLEEYDES